MDGRLSGHLASSLSQSFCSARIRHRSYATCKLPMKSNPLHESLEKIDSESRATSSLPADRTRTAFIAGLFLETVAMQLAISTRGDGVERWVAPITICMGICQSGSWSI